MNCGSVSSHCCSKLCTPLRGEQQATQFDTVAMIVLSMSKIWTLPIYIIPYVKPARKVEFRQKI